MAKKQPSQSPEVAPRSRRLPKRVRPPLQNLPANLVSTFSHLPVALLRKTPDFRPWFRGFQA